MLVSYIFTVHLYNIRLIYYASDDWFFAATPIFTAKKFFKKAAQEPKIFVCTGCWTKKRQSSNKHKYTTLWSHRGFLCYLQSPLIYKNAVEAFMSSQLMCLHCWSAATI